ncbi:MAG: DUF4058 family protein [Ardenticatenaceae bacterium]
MATPFPGMDPYLESKEHWSGFHHHLAEEIMTVLNSALSTRYYAEVEVRMVLQQIDEIGISTSDNVYPDAAVLEVNPQVATQGAAIALPVAPIQRTAMTAEQHKLRSVRVYVAETKRLVTTVELLSPVNKRGVGLEAYRAKRRRILRSDVHLVEIDLLCGGKRPGWEVSDPPIDTDYVLLVNRASNGNGRVSDIWPVALSEPLPILPIPLLPPDADVPLDLGVVLRSIYTRAVYERRIDYRQPVPPPSLRPAMRCWLEEQGIAAPS